MEFVTGLLPLDDSGKLAQARAIESSVPIKYLWDNPEEQPIVADDSEFQAWVDERIKFFDALKKKGYCFFPWLINRRVPEKWRRSDLLIWNQGNVPSCGSTATVHALEYYSLLSIAEGNPVEYTAFNPMYSHFGATKGWTNQGVTMYQSGELLNQIGAFSVEDVGGDNLRSPRDYAEKKPDAGKFKAAIVYIKDNSPDMWFRLGRACLPLAFGSAQFYADAELDGAGMAVGRRVTTGGHAECVGGCWLSVGGDEYLYIQNSHGDIYATDETGKPKSGYWVTKRKCELFCETAENYGAPFVPLPRLYRQDDASFASELNLTRA